MLEPRYDPKGAEARWYAEWLKRGYFHGAPSDNQEPYSIVIPPPNVTGSLHMGHALNNTLQDILIRWKRMSGLRVCWMPGTDHAGIATQNVVERQLAEENLSRESSGGRISSIASGSGKPRAAGPSSASFTAWALLATGSASASRWTRASPAPCARPS